MIDPIKTKSKQNRQVSAFYTWAQVHQSTSNSLAVSQQSTFQPSSKTNPCEASNTNLLCLHQSKQHQHAMPSSKQATPTCYAFIKASNTNMLSLHQKQVTPTCYTFIKNKSLWGKQHQPATSITSQIPSIKPMSTHFSLSTLDTTQKPAEESGQPNYAHLQLDSGRVWCQCVWRSGLSDTLAMRSACRTGHIWTCTSSDAWRCDTSACWPLWMPSCSPVKRNAHERPAVAL